VRLFGFPGRGNILIRPSATARKTFSGSFVLSPRHFQELGAGGGNGSGSGFDC